MASYQVRAANTAPDSENKIHDDATAATYGFRSGLVPGVTVYGYMTPPVLDHFGDAWLERGAMTVHFHEPVYEGEPVDVEARPAENARLELSLGNGRATAVAWMASGGTPPALKDDAVPALPPEDQRPAASHETLAPGTVLGPLVKRLDLNASKITAPLPPGIGPKRIAHPAVLLSLANEVLMSNVVLGPWIHARSGITNFGTAQDGDTLTVHAKVLETYERKGHQFVLLDVLTSKGPILIQHIRHTAIWKPAFIA